MDEFSKLTKLPSHTDREDPFLSLAELKLSLRQILTLLFSVLLCWLATVVTGFIAGFFVELPGPLLWLMFSWIIFGGLFLALKHKDENGNGIRITYEEYLTKRILWNMEPDEWIVKDSHPELGDIEDADWEDAPDFTPAWGGR